MVPLYVIYRLTIRLNLVINLLIWEHFSTAKNRVFSLNTGYGF